MKATAVANANIALVKYWGKRNPELILPHNGSLSMTCDRLSTKTTVEFSDRYDKDIIIINDEELKKDEKDVLAHIERIRKLAGIKQKAKVVSETNFPVAAGLASSASGLAAITLSASKAAGLNLSEKELTILARQGSGSACRSICGGFAEWHRGEREDGLDSYAETFAGLEHWPEFRMIATIVSEKKKPVGSRAGMAKTVETCDLYPSWLNSVNKDIEIIKKGIMDKNFPLVGETSELNCLKLHATMMTTRPPIIYWIPESLEIIHFVRQIREEGIQAYFTMDAGPQVKVICLKKDEKTIDKRLKELKCVLKTIACKPGEGSKITFDHLF